MIDGSLVINWCFKPFLCGSGGAPDGELQSSQLSRCLALVELHTEVELPTVVESSRIHPTAACGALADGGARGSLDGGSDGALDDRSRSSRISQRQIWWSSVRKKSFPCGGARESPNGCSGSSGAHRSTRWQLAKLPMMAELVDLSTAAPMKLRTAGRGARESPNDLRDPSRGTSSGVAPQCVVHVLDHVDLPREAPVGGSGSTRKIPGAHSDSRPAQKGQGGLGAEVRVRGAVGLEISGATRACRREDDPSVEHCASARLQNSRSFRHRHASRDGADD
ncbi:uncharacterized protein LOC133888803 [Phragmites australis]|uniref:uncharacterized protein LOC133888803 n=1 Tax=Phragmites australis TaxID=29695 RepID=UPI002D78A386|nr:uncharacterized protein LOC133888803 [Phragmites australis]